MRIYFFFLSRPIVVFTHFHCIIFKMHFGEFAAHMVGASEWSSFFPSSEQMFSELTFEQMRNLNIETFHEHIRLIEIDFFCFCYFSHIASTDPFNNKMIDCIESGQTNRIKAWRKCWLVLINSKTMIFLLNAFGHGLWGVFRLFRPLLRNLLIFEYVSRGLIGHEANVMYVYVYVCVYGIR